jgi:hypothetical protein
VAAQQPCAQQEQQLWRQQRRRARCQHVVAVWCTPTP